MYNTNQDLAVINGDNYQRIVVSVLYLPNVFCLQMTANSQKAFPHIIIKAGSVIVLSLIELAYIIMYHSILCFFVLFIIQKQRQSLPFRTDQRHSCFKSFSPLAFRRLSPALDRLFLAEFQS